MMSIECSELLWPGAAEGAAVWQGTCVQTGPRRQFPVEAVSSARPPVSSSRLRKTPAGRGLDCRRHVIDGRHFAIKKMEERA